MKLTIGQKVIWTVTGQEVQIRGERIPGNTPDEDVVSCTWLADSAEGRQEILSRPLFIKDLKAIDD